MNDLFLRIAFRSARAWRVLAGPASCLALALPLLAHAPAAHAEAADRDKPINVQANSMTYNDLKQVNVLDGNVVLTKGTIIIRADHVEIHQDPQGYQYATATSADGNLAYFRQKRDGVDEYIEGQAVRIDYDGKRDFTTLTTRAVVRRLQGTSHLIDEVHGSVITYDGQKDFYTAQAGKDNAGPGNSSGRVSAMLSPRTGGAAPLTGASAPLTGTSRLEGSPQP